MMSNYAMNICIQVFMWTICCQFFHGQCSQAHPGVKLLGHMKTLVLQNCQPFPNQQDHLPPSAGMYEGSDFFKSLSTLVIICLFCYREASGCELVLHCDSDWHFPNNNDSQHLFMSLLATCASSLEKYLSDFCPCFNRVV